MTFTAFDEGQFGIPHDATMMWLLVRCGTGVSAGHPDRHHLMAGPDAATPLRLPATARGGAAPDIGPYLERMR